MNQSYAEAGVKRKDTMSTLALRSLMIIGIVVGLICMFIGGVFQIAGIVLVVVLVFLFPRLNIDYEYVFVDGQIDFDRIAGKSKRKTILRIDMEQVEIVAQEGSHALDGYTYAQYENKDFSSRDKSRKPYIIIANIEDKKYRILFEPSEKMLSLMKQKGPRKIAQI
ncbi:MAG: DUF6106 family protein [Herbinix sp.]|nr:DUF6106 family protein [Herbinix sp.]